MIPQVLSLIQRTFTGAGPGPRRCACTRRCWRAARWPARSSAALLVSADLFGSTWRPVFLLNVPVGAVLLIAGLRILPRDAASGAAAWTWPGWPC